MEEAESAQKDEMAQVGKVFYSPLRVFGGSCLAMGGEWVLTCRHGTDKWPARFLAVEIPGPGREGWKLAGVASTASHGRNPGYGDRGNYACFKDGADWIRKIVAAK